MHKLFDLMIRLFIFILFFVSSVKVSFAVTLVEEQNPFTANASLIRYWNKQIHNNLPKPSFLLSKASPLNSVDSTYFVKLIEQNDLSSHLPKFCSSANLFCFTGYLTSLEKHENHDTNIVEGKSGDIELDSSDSDNLLVDSRRELTSNIPLFLYDRDSHSEVPIFLYDGSSHNNFPFFLYDGKSSHNNVPLILYNGGTVGVEAGVFFRESMLKDQTVVKMPDIRDKMPKRSFLPRSISSKLPLSITKVSELKHVFQVNEKSIMEIIMTNTLETCKTSPSRGETKRCVGSIEDIIDLVVSVLGHNVVARSIESTNGAKVDVMIGKVTKINGGRVTDSVSCHQGLFPYMVYHCHAVPKVRVYEADILDVNSQEKINHGVAICHLDTSAWKSDHVAFAVLESSPGQTEVCHWIFEGDMLWTTAD